MNHYRIVIRNNTLKSHGEVLMLAEMKRNRFTKREFGVVTNELFEFAAINCDYSSLAAEIYCNGKEVLTVRCDTRMDGSRILSTISSGDRHIRTATLAA